MTTSAPVPAALTALIEPLVAESGLDIYDLERSGPIIRVIVDLPAERKAQQAVVPADIAGASDDASDEPLPPSVGIADIARLTRAISRAIDEHDPIPGQFTLEVTSPGLERNLRLPTHYSGAVGEKVSVKMVHTYDGPRRIAGRLTAADDTGIDLDVDQGDAVGAPTRLDYVDIDKARTLYEFPAQAKPGSKSKPAKSAKPAKKNTSGENSGPSSKRTTQKSSSKKAKAS